ncbi:MAG TPA: DUF2071 domain-containing protein [Thermomicrobiales bacterium]|nr:DUF2071 domain-containing protein [Thermomicrobiales bacterium]
MVRIPGVQKNPVTMVGALDRCWLFTFRTPAERATSLLPAVLEPVTHDGFAFWNVVVSHIGRMRPRFAPAFTGMSYWHVAYRLYVRLTPAGSSTPIEGLYFIRSDCDSSMMSRAGNLATDFNFHVAAIRVGDSDDQVAIDIDSPGATGRARLSMTTPPEHSPGSAFGSLDEAAAFLKYKPFGISVDERAGEANVVRIVRDEAAWRSRLLYVVEQDWEFLGDQDVCPEICYQVDPIAYQWNRGRVYRV